METEIDRIGWAGGSKMEEFHTDLIFDILTKLDVKTVSRCKCVCKTLNRAISSRGFINAHRRESISRGGSDILFLRMDRDKSETDVKGWIYKFTMVSDETIGTHNNINSIKIPYMFILFPQASNCDLLCFVDLRGGGVLLCNPRTGQVHTLPEPPIDSHQRLRIVFGYVDSMRQYVLLDLFYDYILLKYVIFKFSFSSNYECEGHGDTSCSCSIASSSWKEIEEACPLGRGIWEHGGILINNSVYWWDHWLKSGEIVSLELENEKYKIISCPPEFSEFTATLIDLKGTLVAGYRDTRLSFDIWVLDQFNNCSYSCGWVRKYSINMANILAHPKDCYTVYRKSSRNGELIVTVKTPGLKKHYVCNPEKGSFRALIDPCSGALGPPSEFMNMGFFWESLFSFGVNSY